MPERKLIFNLDQRNSRLSDKAYIKDFLPLIFSVYQIMNLSGLLFIVFCCFWPRNSKSNSEITTVKRSLFGYI